MTGNPVLDALLAASPTETRVRTRPVPARKSGVEPQTVEPSTPAPADTSSRTGQAEVSDEVVRVRAALLARAAVTSLVAELVSNPPEGVSPTAAVRVARWLDERIPRLDP